MVDYTVFFNEDRTAGSDVALEAQKVIFGPLVFQSTNILKKLGILEFGCKNRKKGLSESDFQQHIECSKYGLKVLLEAALANGIFTRREGRYYITKVGYFLHTDKISHLHMEVMENILYAGFAYLEQSILRGTPEGLKVFGDWNTIYEALPVLPKKVKETWLKWDHHHSSLAFPDALKRVFRRPPNALLDVGGNTGKWAVACCNHNPHIHVSIVDIPGQLDAAAQNLKAHGITERVSLHPRDMLDPQSRLPEGCDAIWMSQFLACFSEEEIVSILKKAANVMGEGAVLYILEPFWDRQKEEAAAFSMISISSYFTCFANGNSKLYRSDDLIDCIEKSGLEVFEVLDVGIEHTLLVCHKKK